MCTQPARAQTFDSLTPHSQTTRTIPFHPAERRRCAGGREAGRRARRGGTGRPVVTHPRSGAGVRAVWLRSRQPRMMGSPSLWLLSLGETRESDAPCKAQAVGRAEESAAFEAPERNAERQEQKHRPQAGSYTRRVRRNLEVKAEEGAAILRLKKKPAPRIKPSPVWAKKTRHEGGCKRLGESHHAGRNSSYPDRSSSCKAKSAAARGSATGWHRCRSAAPRHPGKPVRATPRHGRGSSRPR